MCSRQVGLVLLQVVQTVDVLYVDLELPEVFSQDARTRMQDASQVGFGQLLPLVQSHRAWRVGEGTQVTERPNTMQLLSIYTVQNDYLPEVWRSAGGRAGRTWIPLRSHRRAASCRWSSWCPLMLPGWRPGCHSVSGSHWSPRPLRSLRPRRGVYARARLRRKAAQRSGSAGGLTGCARRLPGPGPLGCPAGPDASAHWVCGWIDLTMF